MGIIYNNNYYKIINNKVDFENNQTIVMVRIYGFLESREREKLLQNEVNLLKQNILSYIKIENSNLLNKINEIQDFKTISDIDRFKMDNPSIKVLIEKNEKINEEGMKLISDILVNNVDIDNYLYIDKWKELGLTDLMLKKIDITGEMSLSFDSIKSNDLSSLYNALKERISVAVIDC